jgi:hypothetical protein
MRLTLSPDRIEDYRLFLRIKALPKYAIRGRVAEFPDEYAETLGLGVEQATHAKYEPLPGLFDYQRDIARMAIEKRKFGVFADPGLGKTLVMLEFARHVAENRPRKKKLLVSPLMVIDQTLSECRRFYGTGLPIEQIPASALPGWLREEGGQIGITNYEAIVDGLTGENLAAVLCDESSVMKSATGKWAKRLIDLAAGVEYKLALTGTPAPNDRIEYANHAVFLDQFPTVNSFLARYFVNRGQTQERWEIKQHAIGAFYRSLSHWCIFLSNPAVYGWQDNVGSIPPIQVHIHDVPLTAEQDRLARKQTGTLFANNVGGITQRQVLSRLSKGHYDGQKIETLKPAFIRELIATWPDESTIIWCLYNDEQAALEKLFPEAASIEGKTPHAKRMELLDDFKAGRRKVLLSKPKVLGFGLNLQIATRQVFSGLQDCYDDATEILTHRGWIGFQELAAEPCQVATVNPRTLGFEWQEPSRVICSEHVGPMVRFIGQRNFDLLVTPNHRMFVQRCPLRYPSSNGQWQIRHAGELAESFKRQEYRMLSCPAFFVGERPDMIENDYEVVRPAAAKTIASIGTEDAVRLAAWYLTKGYCRPRGTPEFGRIVICQTDVNPENRKEIICLLGRIAGHVNSHAKDIQCYSRHLATWLLEEFGHGSHNMRMPYWLKNLDGPLLVLLRDTMMRGDGISGGRAYRTASRSLADDFQEICLKTGWRASVKQRIGVCRRYPNDVVFDVTLAKQNTRPSIFVEPEIEDYSGMIGCVTVPNGLVLVRRNGIPVVSGNSYESFYQAVKRSNRVGSTRPLNVHIPVTDLERPMVENVLRKAHNVERDTAEQEALFRAGR